MGNTVSNQASIPRIGSNNKPSFYIRSLLVAGYGFPLSAVYLLPGIMLPNVINDATIRDDGARREALFYSYFVLFQKMGSVRFLHRAFCFGARVFSVKNILRLSMSS